MHSLNHLWRWFAALFVTAFILTGPAWAQSGAGSRLVDAAWLQQNLGQVRLLDASPTPVHAAGHIPGAVSVDIFARGVLPLTAAQMQARMRSWGITPGQRIVIYDHGDVMWATRLFFDLHQHGVPLAQLHLLDGGLPAWVRAGGAVTREATPAPAPAPSSFVVPGADERMRARLPEVLAASGDPQRFSLVDALEPEIYFGARRFIDRGGHVPHAVNWPRQELFDADKTWKSPKEIARVAAHLGLSAGKPVITYCGGGVAATVPFFALRYILGWSDVKVYLESHIEYLRDERQLPMWSEAQPQLLRSAEWLSGWNSPMLLGFGIGRLHVLDLRAPAAFQQGHMLQAVNLPAAEWRTLLREAHWPATLAQRLGAAGVDPANELVLVSQGREAGGVNADAAVAFLMLEKLGHARISLLQISVDEWALRGLPLQKAGTQGYVPPPPPLPPGRELRSAVREGVLLTARPLPRSADALPRVYLSAGAQAPAADAAAGLEGPVLHVPVAPLLQADGMPRPAGERWAALQKAGVPRHAELVLLAGEGAADLGEAAQLYLLLRLAGYADVKVWLR